ncbi:acetoacetate decarboxylase family protein [Pontibacter russatus]|uniref:acetoacetate decarboxylase family protein n=1 Tax=Pontibacter russatus TaxID=2694929 RepID=UPI00137A2EF9|nr:acetoacetate decarboxylase family protein [Pontibacter russatus]
MFGRKDIKHDLFEGTRPASKGKNGELDLPILYFRNDYAYACFTADAEKVKHFLPSDKLHLIKISQKRCVISIAVSNFIHTTIGSYGEIAIGIPVTFNKKQKGLLSLIRQSQDPAFGILIQHLPVTSQAALIAGRSEWGYPKFIADMNFQCNTNTYGCNLSSDGKKIFDIQMDKRGFLMRDDRPLVCFGVQNGNLIKEINPASGISAVNFNISGISTLNVYSGHPMSDDWLSINPSKKPFMVVFNHSHQVYLPEGTIIETGVRPNDGNVFLNGGKDGIHTVCYNGTIYELTNASKDTMICNIK